MGETCSTIFWLEDLKVKDHSENLDVHGKITMDSPPCLERLWGPPSPLSNWYQGLIPGREADHIST